MKRDKIKNWLVMALVVLSGVLATACGAYYKVTDPVTGSIYYTEEVKHTAGGAAQFKDERSGAQVTIQNSEVREITSKEFETGLKSTPTPKAAPAPAAPAPAPAPAPSGSSSP